MIKHALKKIVLLFTLCISAGAGLSYADVLVDMDKADEIVISNTQEDIAYTFKIDEPSQPVRIASSEDNNADVNQQANVSDSSDNIVASTETPNVAPTKSDSKNKQAYDLNVAKLVKDLPFSKEVALVAKETSVEPALIHAIISAESNHNPRAKSPKGAYGLMQLMPATARYYKVTDKNDPKQNILAGAKLLRELLDVFNGDIKLSLAAYNAGLPAVLKHQRKIPPYKETQRYIPRVLSFYKKFT